MDTIRLNPFHTTDVKELSIDGTVVTLTATELDQYVLNGEIADVSTGASYWVVAPYAGTIEKIYTVINGAIITAAAELTFEIGGVAVTDGAISIVTAGSAAGIVDSSTPSAANVVTAGQPIEMLTAGASENTVIAYVTFLMQRT